MKLWLFVLCGFTRLSVGRLYHGAVRLEGDVNIGALTSLHSRQGVNQCGRFETLALGVTESIVFAVQTINQNETLLPGITLGYDIHDCCQSPMLGAKNAYQFALRNQEAKASIARNDSDVLKPVVAVVGGLVSETALMVSTMLQAIGIPIIGSLATSEQLSAKSHQKFLRTIPGDGDQAKAIADLIEYFGWRYVTVIAEDDLYGRSGIPALQREARSRNTFCLGMTKYVTISEFDRIVYQLKQQKTVSVIVLWVLHSTGKSFLDKAIEQGVVGYTWIMSESLSMQRPEYLGPKLISQGNYIGVLPHRHGYESLVSHIKQITPNRSRENPWWYELWEKEFGCSPNKWDEHLCVTNSILMKLTNDFVPFVIDAVYAIAHALDAILKCKEPNGLLLGGRCPRGHISHVSSDDLLVYLQNVSFEGLTGIVEFDARGDPKHSLIDIVYLHMNTEKSPRIPRKLAIGTWEERAQPSLLLQAHHIRWHGHNDSVKRFSSECHEECKPGTRKAKTTDCCWECIGCSEGWVTAKSGQINCTKCPKLQHSNGDRSVCVDLPMSNVRWTDVSSMVLVVSGVFGVVLTVVVFIVLVRYRDTPVVKASNPEIGYILLLGSALCFVKTILHFSRPTSTICALQQPIRYIILTSCCSILVLKTMRILQAFQTNRVEALIEKLIKSATRQLMTLSAMMLIDVTLAVCWVVLDPPHLKMTPTQDGQIFLSCKSFSNTTGMALMISMISYLILLSLLCTYYAFRARKLPANFNEAKYIAFSMYIILLSWIAYFPVGYLLQDWYSAVVSSATSLLNGYSVLGCIFLPKVYIILFHPEKNTRVSCLDEVCTTSSDCAFLAHHRLVHNMADANFIYC